MVAGQSNIVAKSHAIRKRTGMCNPSLLFDSVMNDMYYNIRTAMREISIVYRNITK